MWQLGQWQERYLPVFFYEGGKVNDEKNFYDDFGSYDVHDVFLHILRGRIIGD